MWYELVVLGHYKRDGNDEHELRVGSDASWSEMEWYTRGQG